MCDDNISTIYQGTKMRYKKICEESYKHYLNIVYLRLGIPQELLSVAVVVTLCIPAVVQIRILLQLSFKLT